MNGNYALFMDELATLQQAAVPTPYWPETKNIPIEREAKMQNICLEVNARQPSLSDPDREKRMHLECRLNRAQYPKRTELFKLFGLEDDDEPTTYAEMKTRLLAGKFTLPKDRVEDSLYDDYDEYPHTDDSVRTNALRWRDPAKYADKKGFAAAEKEMDAAQRKAMDLIKVGTPAEGLAALQAFEAWQTTVVPVTVAPAN